MENQREKFYELLKDFKTAILVSRTSPSTSTSADLSSPTENDLDMRPMSIAKIEKDCDLWFITSADSDVAKEVAADPRVSVIAQHEQDCILTLTGSGKVIQDAELVQQIWKEPYKVWFPEGPEDPTIRLIYVNAITGEYWNVQGAEKVKYLFEAAKAYLTGERPNTEEGEQHGTVQLS